MYQIKTRKRSGLCLLLALLFLNSLFVFDQPPARAANLTWKDTGFKLTTRLSEEGAWPLFFDSSSPNILYYGLSLTNGYFVGTIDLKTGATKLLGDTSSFPEQIDSLSARPGYNGYVFAKAWKFIDGTSHGSYKRFSIRNPVGTPVDHLPDSSGEDGSLISYSLEVPDQNDPSQASKPRRLWVSLDGGLSWQERGQQFSGAIQAFSASQSDSKNLYLLTRPPGNDADTYKLNLYFSSDAGANWEQRNQFTVPARNESVGIGVISGHSAPVDAVMLYNLPYSRLIGYDYALSLDGGRTFNTLEANCLSDCRATMGSKSFAPHYWFGKNSLMRLYYNPTSQSFELGVSTANQTWNSRAIPQQAQALDALSIQVVPFAPTNLLLTGRVSKDTSLQLVWYSANEGQSWQPLPDSMSYYRFTPYQPLTLLGMKDRQLYTMELPANGRQLTDRTTSNHSTSGYYSNETGHNLNGALKQYWEQHGGLAQFGYPFTEPFLELNHSDGRVYLTQYFERNRLEYHPENAETPYEVLLGLLGNQVTAGRSQEAPFQKIAAFTSRPDSRYFAETGHRLSLGFKSYWEQNGGLSIYGYPISEEFQELNPDNGKTYTVQYFERARFEYHPEYAGTKYEVLLGLLGNALLRQKGWL
jgi:hypothetical protein